MTSREGNRLAQLPSFAADNPAGDWHGREVDAGSVVLSTDRRCRTCDIALVLLQTSSSGMALSSSHLGKTLLSDIAILCMRPDLQQCVNLLRFEGKHETFISPELYVCRASARK